MHALFDPFGSSLSSIPGGTDRKDKAMINAIFWIVDGVAFGYLAFFLAQSARMWNRPQVIRIDLNDPRTHRGTIYFPPTWYRTSKVKRRLFYSSIVVSALIALCFFAFAILLLISR